MGLSCTVIWCFFVVKSYVQVRRAFSLEIYTPVLSDTRVPVSNPLKEPKVAQPFTNIGEPARIISVSSGDFIAVLVGARFRNEYR